ncbi:MAG TPA: exosortase/archaeosortase family protein [Longimicrobium sp.]
MTELALSAAPRARARLAGATAAAAPVIAAAAFAVLFWRPAATLARDWWSDPNAGHGLLLAPVAAWLAWRAGLVARPAPRQGAGVALLAGAVGLRWLSGLAAELFTMRLSLLVALAALVVFVWGWRQVARWWLPFGLLVLCIPLPAVVMASLALPLQFKASALGAAMLHWRNIPVELTGNVINLPGRSLFVTEACSGLRSLSALLAIALLAGGLWLRTATARGVLLALALPVAVLLNGVRVFLTGFLVVFVDPRLGDGFMHLTEGWLIYLAALAILGAIAAGLTRVERRFVPEAA